MRRGPSPLLLSPAVRPTSSNRRRRAAAACLPPPDQLARSHDSIRETGPWIPYTPPERKTPAGSRSFASRPSRLETKSDSLHRLGPELEHFLALETREERLAARDAVCRAISSATASTTAALPRADFDSLWSRIAILEPAVSAAILKRLRDYALRSYGDGDGDVPLSHEQKRQIFAARSAQEQFETRLRTRRAPRQSREAGAQSGVGVGKVLRGRRAYLDRCADEFFESVQSRRRRFGPVAAEEEGDDLLEGSRDEEEEADAHVLETYAQRLVERSSSSSSSAETAPSSFETADRASQFLLLALSLRAPLAASVEEPVISPLYSTPLPVLFAHNPLSGIRYLQAMLDKGRLPTPASIREIVRAYYRDPPVVVWAETGAAGITTLEEEEARRTPRRDRGKEEEEEEAVYARARQVLDEACSVGSSSPFGRSALLHRDRPPATTVGGNAHAPEYDQQHPLPSDRLESLLQERLERVDRAEALAHEPTLYMIRWLGLLRRLRHRHRLREVDKNTAVGTAYPSQAAAIALEERQAALECALSLWEVSQVRGRDEFQVGALQTSRSTVARLLESLVLEACELESESAAAAAAADGDQKKRQASRAMEKALELAGKYMQHQVLVHHSPKLLRAVTVSANAPHLALALFDVLTNPPRRLGPTSASRRRRRAYHPPFTWTLDLLPIFVSLFLSSVAPSAKDDSLPIRLYLSWTASGLSFPDGLWNDLWRALGRRGSVEELARVCVDWEETGRGQIAGRISALVLAAAAEPPIQSIRPAQSSTTATITTTPLRLLGYFRSRYIRPGESAPSPALLASSPYLVVPLAGYTAVLRSLARSHSDQRPAQRVVWRYLLRDGHAPDLAAYNALLAAHVWRPDPFFTVKDLDDAGVVYNQLIEAGRRRGGDGDVQPPDRETFSLLVHGFLRVANSNRVGRQKREITLEAAHRTFTAAADRGFGLRGHQAARLVRTLAHSGRFEDAKVVQEKWWRTLVALESEWDRWRKSHGRRGKRGESMWDDEEIKGEMREMRMARDDAERIEARNGAVASVASDASEPEPSVVEDADDAAEVGIEEDEGAETAEAFATLPLASVGSTAP
ncbi:hypothetical protein C6P46_005807 [Rhodotorula mucilaginosa]|uniref:Uncharacterized protein n=1 Tax=Rhodotorula mucilaginosa TaxID=5537 RepID=A0A9P6VZV0_RHOMI|nr:hypothetical protein C6P46_005807 [Rhodotorula mucilaginosa]